MSRTIKRLLTIADKLVAEGWRISDDPSELGEPNKIPEVNAEQTLIWRFRPPLAIELMEQLGVASTERLDWEIDKLARREWDDEGPITELGSVPVLSSVVSKALKDSALRDALTEASDNYRMISDQIMWFEVSIFEGKFDEAEISGNSWGDKTPLKKVERLAQEITVPTLRLIPTAKAIARDMKRADRLMSLIEVAEQDLAVLRAEETGIIEREMAWHHELEKWEQEKR